MRTGLLLLLIFSLTACQEKKEGLHREWRMMKVRLVEPDNSVSNVELQQKVDELVEAHLHLYADEQYALLYKNGRYVTQKWTYDYKTERLTLIGNTPQEEIALKIRGEGKNWVEFEWINKKQKSDNLPDFVIRLLCNASTKYEYGETDLLSPARNQWRIKPTSAQSEEQIRKRLLQQLTYCIDYFKLIEEKEQSYFEVALLQSPFRFYNHGFGIASASDLPERWTETFYNESDARKAQVMLAEALHSSGDYPRAKSFVEEYRTVLESMRLYLER